MMGSRKWCGDSWKQCEGWVMKRRVLRLAVSELGTMVWFWEGEGITDQ